MDWIANDTLTISTDASADEKYAAGLDYLNGHDSAVRHRKAIQLIGMAAHSGHEEAMVTMAQLHRRGVGMGLLFQGEIFWLKKLVDMAENRYYTELHREFGERCCDYMEQLCLAHISVGNMLKAQEVAERWHQLATHMHDQYTTILPLATAELRLSDLFAYCGSNEMALMYAKSAYERTIHLCRTEPVPQQPLAVAYGAAMRANRLMFIIGKEPGSNDADEEALNLQSAVTHDRTPEALRDHYNYYRLQVSHPMRTKVEDRKAIWLQQMSLYRRAIATLEEYAAKSPLTEVKEELAEKYMEFAGVCKERDNFEEAVEFYDKAYAQWKALFDRRPGAQYQFLMAKCLRLQLTPLLRRYAPVQAGRKAFLACSLVAQFRDPDLTHRAKDLLLANYREIYEHYTEYHLWEEAEKTICKIGVLERKPQDKEAESQVYLKHLVLLHKKGMEYADENRYAHSLSCFYATILFAELFLRRLPRFATEHAGGLRVILNGTIIRIYRNLGTIESKLGNKNAARECRRMSRHLRNQDKKT